MGRVVWHPRISKEARKAQEDTKTEGCLILASHFPSLMSLLTALPYCVGCQSENMIHVSRCTN